MTEEEFSLRVKKERPRLICAARRIAWSYDDAEDLLQTTLLRAYRYRDRFDPKRCTFFGWCLIQMKHIFWEDCRKGRRMLSYNEDRGKRQVDIEVYSAVEELFSQLNEKERRILMDLYNGYSARETAARWKVTRHYVQQLKMSARALAKTYL